MVIELEDWLKKLAGSHRFKESGLYGNNNSNKVVRLSAAVSVKLPSGKTMEFDEGSEVCLFRPYRTRHYGVIATIFSPDEQVSIMPGGSVRVRPYPHGMATS